MTQCSGGKRGGDARLSTGQRFRYFLSSPLSSFFSFLFYRPYSCKIESSSISKIRVDLGPISAPAPRGP